MWFYLTLGFLGISHFFYRFLKKKERSVQLGVFLAICIYWLIEGISKLSGKFFLILLSVVFLSQIEAHETSESLKEKAQKQLEESVEKGLKGVAFIAFAGTQVASGNFMAAALLATDGIGDIKECANTFKEACETNREARELENRSVDAHDRSRDSEVR